jgi:acetyl esterase/lipase
VWECTDIVTISPHSFYDATQPLLWYSNGSIRFQLIKRGMDLLYASIGKAIEITRGHEIVEPSITTSKSSSLWTYVVASLTASYYNVIGPAAKSASSLANAPSSIIQNAWGMVSLPAVKKASLEATRILKGAAIADRIEICGGKWHCRVQVFRTRDSSDTYSQQQYAVSCFVLSRESFPALASALRRFHRQQEREDSKLGTIYETMSNHPSTVNINKGFQRRDIILHLTGGGFFAHTIAGDLPYLLDWSATTNAVIIVPEYSLFPHKYPDAINEVTQIYRALRFGQAATILGFQSDRIIVSGESVGGNLATALCVSLVMDHKEGESYDLPQRRTAEFNDLEDALGFSVCERLNSGENSREICNSDIPDALLLCCPALNLSLDLTPSRVDGANDPVLPSALISTISASYLGGCSSTDPIASPYFASDAIICNFPPTLIFTSSEDPLLDDSVTFNSRLRSVGVKSSLRAVHDLPHAFWGLSTAGIPEARQVQKECQQFLARFCSDAQ